MRQWRAVLSISMAMSVFLSFWVQAHEGHEHAPVSMKRAVEIALATASDASRQPLPALALPQLEKSWEELPETAAQIVENGRGYYWVKVDNAAQAQSLFVRIQLDGRVDAANFSGASVSD